MRGFGLIGKLAAALCLVGAGFAAARFVSAPPEVQEPLHADVAMNVGSTAILVNSAFMVRRVDRFGGRVDELPLALEAGTMQPASPPGPLALGEIDAAPHTLYVTLLARDEKLAPPERTARLYLRHLSPETSESLAGLSRRAFTQTSPYRSEDLHFTPPAGGLFAARCLRDIAGEDLKQQEEEKQTKEQEGEKKEQAEKSPPRPALRLPLGCVADLRVGGVDVRLRFQQPLLEDWEAITAAVTQWVSGLQKAAEKPQAASKPTPSPATAKPD